MSTTALLKPTLLACMALCACADSPPPSSTRAPEPTGSTSPQAVTLRGAFAFADTTGSELLSLETSAAPESYSAAVCSQGRYAVRYLRTQSARPESSHRQVAGNFGNEPGNVFQLAGGNATPNETCFLTTDSLLARIDAAPESLNRAACAEPPKGQLAKLAGRNVLHCWRLAQVEGGSEFVAAQFMNVDTSALAAVALVRDSVVLFYPLPGRYSGPGESIWRVDDGGVFDPDALRPLFTVRLPRGHAAALLWAGPEGESNQLLVADSTVLARSVMTAYRYWSPQ